MPRNRQRRYAVNTGKCLDCPTLFTEADHGGRKRCQPCSAAHYRKACQAAARRSHEKRRVTPEFKAARIQQERIYRIMHYGITPAELEAILAAQGGACAGCGRRPTGRRLDIDHKHQPREKKATRESRRPMVRGLLCHLCNRAVGILRDNPTTLRRLADYLDRPPAVTVLSKRIPSGSRGKEGA
jgi:hypothetical protein